MQCLHCGKELALFKRLTKGEFCSEDHRQAYQREYSQMALSRLLQAKPPGERSEKERAEKEAAEPKTIGKRWNAGSGPISLGLSDAPAPAAPTETGKGIAPEAGKSLAKEAARMAGRDAGKLASPGTPSGAEAKGLFGAGRITPEPTAKIPLKIAKTGEEKAGKVPQSETPGVTARKEPFQVEKPVAPLSPLSKDLRRNLSETAATTHPAESSAASQSKTTEETILKQTAAPENTPAEPATEIAVAAEAQAPAPLASGIADLPAGYPGEIPPAKLLALEMQNTPATPAVAGHKLSPRVANFPWGGRVRVPTGGQPGAGTRQDAGNHAEAVEFAPTASLGQLHAALAEVEAPAPAHTTVEVPASIRRASPCLSFWHAADISFTGFSVAVGELARLRLPTAEVDDAERRRTKVRTSSTKASDPFLAQPGEVPTAETDRREHIRRNTADIYGGSSGSELLSDDELARKPRSGPQKTDADGSDLAADAALPSPLEGATDLTPDAPASFAEAGAETASGVSLDPESGGLGENALTESNQTESEHAQTNQNEADENREEANAAGFNPAQLAQALAGENDPLPEEAAGSDATSVAALPARRPVIKIMRSKPGAKQDLAGFPASNGDASGGKLRTR